MLIVNGSDLGFSFNRKAPSTSSLNTNMDGVKTMQSKRTPKKEIAVEEIKSVEELNFKPLEIKWSMDYDIISTHEKVLEYIKAMAQKITILEKRIVTFSNSSKQETKLSNIINIRNEIATMRNEIDKLNKISISDYTSEVCLILNEYKSLCNSGPRIFGKKEEISIVNLTKKAKLVEEYFEIAKKYCPMNVIRNIKMTGNCYHCDGVLVDEGENMVCSNCNSITVKMEANIKYSEGEEQFINKELTKKDINFKEIFMQWQGTYPVNIPPRVYEQIKEYAARFDKMDLSKISKLDLYKIMNELGLGQWYKHLSKIHIYFTKKHTMDVSKYEANVIKRGEYINQIYHEIKNPDRSNFLHGLHLIWLFLMNEGCIPDMADFVLIKNRSVEYSNLEVLERGFSILRKTHPEMQWKIYELP